ncbi:Small glutamine-rich tetratricopeptide repeat-containing protein 2 [Diplodia seriata]|uniref:Small glutamine-rich tetratricopeptide repeat-containing protein 2 n=1 Tax=Diplodia seriata TaxID=420778 RepID=A0A1S8BLP1_9PEZI|nr:Small glutamine-rich tetratricopeptide repeat-containing protein 2 [Diplodia seriata]
MQQQASAAAPVSTESKKRLALAIIDFLNTSTRDGTLSAEDSESIEIATNCIAESFHVDPTDTAATAEALGGQNLASIYSVYEKLKGRTTPSTEGASSAKEARPSTPTTTSSSSTSDNKTEAERLKGLGNAAMQKKDYDSAIALYTQALDLVPLNPIYLSNRAAAYSGAGRHNDARQDAEMATAADPAYTKAWSRLGLARYALGDAKGSMEAYEQGIRAEGNGGSDAMKRGYETAKRRVDEEGGSPAARSPSPPGAGAGGGGMPDLSSLASMLGGGGGGGGQGGGGGMPDFGALMNNPMLRQMAQNVMSNPQMMQNMLSNPRLREMAEQFGGGGGAGAGAGGAGAGAGAQGGAGGGGGGGGMPDFSQMMQDPSIMEMARNLMGGGGGGAPGGAGGAGAGRGGAGGQ